MRILLFFLFCSWYANAQEVLFEGHIYDNKTKEPIPFVNLSFLETLRGSSTDENGKFFLDVPKTYLEKKIHISSLGYKDTIVAARTLYTTKKLNMVEDSFELDEVVVTEDLGDSFVLNPISSYDIKSGFYSSSTPWVLATYFPNIGAAKKYLGKITIFMQDNSDYKRNVSKFRVRIYDVDPKTKKPKNDLLRHSIVLESDREKDFVSIDISDFQIKVPQEGIYIGLEWLFVAYNWYMVKEIDNIDKEKTIFEDRFAPTFAGVYNKNNNFKVMVYGMGEWTDFEVRSKDRTKHLIPAVSLKLSREKKK